MIEENAKTREKFAELKYTKNKLGRQKSIKVCLKKVTSRQKHLSLEKV